MSTRSRRRRQTSNGLDAWPGYVDALSTLLMVIIFVLLVFVLGQAFLTVSLNGRNAALERMTKQMSAISDALALEKTHAAALTASNATLARQAEDAAHARDTLITRLDEARTAAGAATAERDAARTAATTITGKLAAATTAATALQAGVATLTTERDAAVKLSNDEHTQLDLLNRQMDQARQQLASLAAALDTAKTQAAADARAKDTKIADLGAKLNTALASKVLELQRYRSDFFGRLRDVLANRPGIQVVGDRFVFQSEVLFPPGSADMTASGAQQIAALADTLKQIEPTIPADLPWVLRVDGHADRQPVTDARFPSNWELSSQRAINVVKLLIADGLPANRLAAAGFADNQPLDTADTPEAFAKNRRIELRLTDR